jgi:polyphenol oxidase
LVEQLGMWRSELITGAPNAFFGRQGGVSNGSVTGLNCGLGSGDDPDDVARNRSLAAKALLPGARLVGLYQTHSTDVVTVTEPWPDAARPHADALVTARRGILLGIVTADCAPVLFHDPVAGVIGAAHAGWRGALGGIVEQTISAMVAIGADRDRILASIGPCIAAPSYEVGEDFRSMFETRWSGDWSRFFTTSEDYGRPAEGKWYFDLAMLVSYQLITSGIVRRQERWPEFDTYADSDKFYSFRRATHRQEPDYGRQIALIGLA